MKLSGFGISIITLAFMIFVASNLFAQGKIIKGKDND